MTQIAEQFEICCNVGLDNGDLDFESSCDPYTQRIFTSGSWDASIGCTLFFNDVEFMFD